MFYWEHVYDFFKEKRSIVEVVDNFLDQFFDIYEQLDMEDQDLMAECFQQMFRKYHYSALISDTPITPANIINTLVEREFGSDIMLIPTFKLDFDNNKKIKNIRIGVRTFSREEHFFVADFEELLQFAKVGIPVSEPGIIPPEQYGALMDNITIADRHYINILCLSALEAGYLAKKAVRGKLVVKTSNKAEDFLSLGGEEKLGRVISAVVRLCSRTILRELPYLEKEFSDKAIRDLLKKPKDYDLILEPVLRKLGISMKDLEEFNSSSLHKENEMKDIFSLSLMLDMYFYTPFAYYLQLIQPIYEDEYDIEFETDKILMNSTSIHSARLQLFLPPMSYDLTPLGESLRGAGRKPNRKQRLPAEIGDNEMYKAVEINMSGVDIWEEEDHTHNSPQYKRNKPADVISLAERREKKKAEALKPEDKDPENT